ncbi:hypothetical protein GCM10022254_03410 [Actinomadura meridiana]|uniref:Uncharacterized protein n=1 Tax=Actinomadura meridiana TaxID=559626 RepID=A0ABP8BS09_9ACTN
MQILDGAGYRIPVVADLLRRVAERARGHVAVACTAAFPMADDWTDYNIAPFEVVDTPLADADVEISEGRADGLCLTVPRETGDPGTADALVVRLAMLEVPYRVPLELSAARLAGAGERLARWRSNVAEWATAPGRPMNREYATRAEGALADDLDAPSALATLDRLADDADVPPGAKLETFIHLDLLLALGLVAAIGSA